MFSFLLNQDISEGSVLPCYFLHGEEMFLAYQFLEDLQASLIAPDDEDFHVERFDLGTHSWVDIFDSARTIPFFLSSWRIFVVDVVKGKGEKLSPTEKQIFSDFFDSPPARSVMVLICPFKMKKNDVLYKTITGLSSKIAGIHEMKPLKDYQVVTWMDRKLKSEGKTASSEAKGRLLELAGNNLSRINNELDKLVTYAFDRHVIEIDDVNQVSGFIKSFFEWEISNCLEKADYKHSLIVLNELLWKEGAKPEYILGLVAKFFRDLFLAKLWLKEGQKDRKGIFKELKPQIQERFGTFYTQKFKEFFSFVDRLTLKDLRVFLRDLEDIDLRIKTSDASLQVLLEGFLYRYCTAQNKTIWRKSY